MDIIQFSNRDKERYSELKTQIKQGWLMFAQGILEVRQKKLYKLEYGTFEEFCQSELGITQQYATQTLRSAEVVKNLENETIVSLLPQTESQARPLTKLQPTLQREAWKEVVESNAPNEITAKKVAEVAKEFEPLSEEIKERSKPSTVFEQRQPMSEKEILERAKEIRDKKPHVANNSEQNEWYTPSKFIEIARRVMGSIDLDPASNDIANEVVKASCIYTHDTNGLDKNWHGNVWLNPPYAQPLMEMFAEKVAEQTINFNQCIVLVNNATETKWFQLMAKKCSCICFPSSRVKFWHPDRGSSAPLQGQAILYFGENKELFCDEFSKIGFCVYA